jgi:hypothetical protein
MVVVMEREMRVLMTWAEPIEVDERSWRIEYV